MGHRSRADIKDDWGRTEHGAYTLLKAKQRDRQHTGMQYDLIVLQFIGDRNWSELFPEDWIYPWYLIPSLGS